jgi:predicted MPP superfamily phosphohydrolase
MTPETMRPIRTAGGMTRRQFVQGALATAVGVASGVGAYGYLYERHRIAVTRDSLPVSGLPDALAGLRVGLLTDLHHSRTVGRDQIAAAVALLLQEAPDLVVLGGDFVTWGDRGYVGACAELLAPLTAPHGVFAILGNHDDDRDMPGALQRRGFEVLKDERTTVELRGERLELVGIRFWTRKIGELTRLLRGASGTTMLLAHDPRRLAEAAALDVPLILSGHTHGGQVVLPGVGAVAARGRAFPTLAGVIRRDNTTLFVSRGIGTVYVPCRINCPPEVAILTLARRSDI